MKNRIFVLVLGAGFLALGASATALPQPNETLIASPSACYIEWYAIYMHPSLVSTTAVAYTRCYTVPSPTIPWDLVLPDDGSCTGVLLATENGSRLELARAADAEADTVTGNAVAFLGAQNGDTSAFLAGAPNGAAGATASYVAATGENSDDHQRAQSAWASTGPSRASYAALVYGSDVAIGGLEFKECTYG